MGFIRNKKNNNNNFEYTDSNEDFLSSEEENKFNKNTYEETEQDDFATTHGHTIPSKEEFVSSAIENLKAAVQNNDSDSTHELNDEDEFDDEFEPEDDFDLGDDYVLPTPKKSDLDLDKLDVPNFSDADDDYDSYDDNYDDDYDKGFSMIKKHITNKNVLKKIGIVCAALGAVCIILFIFACATVPKDTIGRNVYIEDVNVSNLTPAEAVNKLQNANLLSMQDISLNCSGKSFLISAEEAGLTAKIEDTVDKAMRYGKTKNPLLNGLANGYQFIAKHNVIPSADVSEVFLRDKLTEFGKQIYGELVESTMELGDGGVVCVPGHSGFDMNTDEAYNQIRNALEDEKFTNISVTLKKGAPKELTVSDVDTFVYTEPADAFYKKENGTIIVVPEVVGRYIDKPQTESLLKAFKEGGEVLTIPYVATPANIKAADLEEKLFDSTIGSYATSYGTSTSNRCANIANAAGRINGTVLMPGEVFSFNEVVGKRTTANGFYTAKEYVDGQTVDGIGGGTCQVSSTLYNAVIYSDLSIVTRTNHMFPVGYCPLGQDATVADTGVDFKFVNSMDYPIKIVGKTSGYTVTISIVGTQRNDPRTVKIVNTSNATSSGTQVYSTRNVYNSAGTLISSDSLPGSFYKPHN